MDKNDLTSGSEEGIDWGGSAAQEGKFIKKMKTLPKNVHTGLPTPLADPVKFSLVKGDYLYFYYLPPPSLPETQQALVSMGDKPGSFSGSREWIGTFEASLVLDYFYDVPCKLVHIRGGGVELEQVAVEELHQHFQKHGCPVMMGGDRDNSSKGIVGVCTDDKGSHLLIVDPHYYGGQLEKEELQRRGEL
eukprot:superscaffoldBa00001267_g9812